MSYATLTDMMAAGKATARAVRWWEAQGLLGKVDRQKNGNRMYTPDHLERARFIGAGQAAGWDLNEIRTEMLRWKKVRQALEHRLAVTQKWLAEIPEYDL